MESMPYTNTVTILMYARICTRPNIAHAISVVSRFITNPKSSHWHGVK